MRLPEDQRAERPCAKDLLARPKRIGGLLSAHNVDRRLRQTPVSRRFGLKAVRRLQKSNAPGRDRLQRRQQQSHFTHARLLHQQIGERALGPATSRQFSGKRLRSTRHDVHASRGQLRTSPQTWMNVFEG